MPLSRFFNIANMSFNAICEKYNSRENFQIYSICPVIVQFQMPDLGTQTLLFFLV